MKNWFTSDTHFNHNNIIKYCNRPFKDTKHMNDTIIKNWNERVSSTDCVFFLGDFCFGNPKEFLNELNGNIVFIKGNHDYGNSLNPIIQNVIINIGNKELYLVHNPRDASEDVPINLVGHVHEKWEVKRLTDDSIMINVGVDVNNYRPINYEEIEKIYNNFLKEEDITQNELPI